MRTELDVSASFSEDIRLRILLLLKDASLCVKCMVASLDSLQPNVSRHLSTLRKNGIVKKLRKGGRAYYSLNFNGENSSLKKGLVAIYNKELHNKAPYKLDRKRLVKVFKNVCDSDCVVSGVKKKRRKIAR